MYRKFKSLKEGDILYCVEIKNDSYKFQAVKIKYIISDYDDDYLEVYIDKSPLSFDFKKNQSSWHNLIFTTKEEAIRYASKEVNDKIKYYEKNIKKFSKLIRNINNIEFKE